MALQHEDAYLESRVYAATPAELIQLLYETALDAVREAIQADDPAQLPARARAISKASSCVMELAGSLNLELGGELGLRLSALYEYLLHELLEASARRNNGSLASCERVLQSLMEGWSLAMGRMGEAGPEIHGSTANGIPEAIANTPALVRAATQASLDLDEATADDLVGERASWCA
ncbi:MAG: flagellar export chaperone FliS [Bryobacterales bacterium]|jgi:flagellar protein FliS|nr:flagellar export chaperone FliS [Bryobacterales bacterium]